jgi:hypothetical protein
MLFIVLYSSGILVRAPINPYQLCINSWWKRAFVCIIWATALRFFILGYLQAVVHEDFLTFVEIMGGFVLVYGLTTTTTTTTTAVCSWEWERAQELMRNATVMGH